MSIVDLIIKTEFKYEFYGNEYVSFVTVFLVLNIIYDRMIAWNFQPILDHLFLYQSKFSLHSKYNSGCLCCYCCGY